MRVDNAWNRPLLFGNQAATPRPLTSVQPSNIPFNFQFVLTEAYVPSSQPSKQDPRLAHPGDCTCKVHPTQFTQSPNVAQVPSTPATCSKENLKPTTSATSSSLDAVRDGNTTHLQPQQPVPERRPANPTHRTVSDTCSIHRAAGKRNFQQPDCMPPAKPTIPTNLSPHHKRLDDISTEHQTQEFVNIVRTFNPSFSFQGLLQSLTAMLLQFIQHPYKSAFPVIFNTFLSHLLGFNYG
jgi:hypothetical protein